MADVCAWTLNLNKLEQQDKNKQKKMLAVSDYMLQYIVWLQES